MNLVFNREEGAALLKELDRIIDAACFHFSPRIQTAAEILRADAREGSAEAPRRSASG